MTGRQCESAAIEKVDGMYRLIQVSWEKDAAESVFDYYHAAFELDGRWNAEFFNDCGSAIWVYGTEDCLDFEWEIGKLSVPNSAYESKLNETIEVLVSDIEYHDVPVGSLCQTVEERAKGIPRHWKKWRII